ncbi:hypothetical protein QYE76_061275 [Lolium multiflorum]|uniref:phosphopyruvate hydratase n=1 Tax=Lolium multiflorum TaxID=4521 RepID=A0AAD8S2V6_LOLMU|nr:hypothetical protein QYE76_061275 [Lolium multiflorum]
MEEHTGKWRTAAGDQTRAWSSGGTVVASNPLDIKLQLHPPIFRTMMAPRYRIYLEIFADEYPIFPIEDPFDHDDWVHYAKMTEEIGEQRVAKAIAEKSCNAILLKVLWHGGCFDEIKFFASSTSSTLAAGGCHPTAESVLAQISAVISSVCVIDGIIGIALTTPYRTRPPASRRAPRATRLCPPTSQAPLPHPPAQATHATTQLTKHAQPRHLCNTQLACIHTQQRARISPAPTRLAAKQPSSSSATKPAARPVDRTKR